MIKTLIFDLGNVIVNVDENKFFEKSAIDCNKSVSFIKKYYEKSNSRKAFERGEISPMQFYHTMAADLNLKMGFDEFKNAWCGIFTLNKNMERFIKNVKKNFKLVLLSNTDALHFEHIKNKFKVVNDFDEHALSYKVGCRKPNPLIFLTALSKARAMPFNCVYIDDIPQFVYVARLMGIKAFQYVNFEKFTDDLKSVNVTN
ncbi:HAD family phosphatase [Candidatus Woesearchaeota archaeon]|nr:HAD family phosphatase [Candidatus Woesearchaeota archaeon]